MSFCFIASSVLGGVPNAVFIPDNMIASDITASTESGVGEDRIDDTDGEDLANNWPVLVLELVLIGAVIMTICYLRPGRELPLGMICEGSDPGTNNATNTANKVAKIKPPKRPRSSEQ